MYRPYANSLPDFRPFRDAESQIRDLTQDFATAFNTGNYDQAAGMFAADGALMVPCHEARYGQKPVEQLLRQLGEAEYCSLRLETMRVEHSGDMAMEIGQFSAVVRNTDGTNAPAREVCESMAQAGSVANQSRLLESDAGSGERSRGLRE